MTEASESRWAETTGPLIEQWRLDSGSGPRTSTRTPVAPVSALGFELGDPVSGSGATGLLAETIDRGGLGSPKEITFPEAGDVLGGFRIVGELGRGAFARVYLAEQVELAGRLVALKVAEALGDEPQALARLQHAHIVPIHSVHDDPTTGLRLLCMPYVGGANLAQVLERSTEGAASNAQGRSLVEALDEVAGCPSERGDAGRFAKGGGTPGPGSPTEVRSVLGRYWAGFAWARSLAGGSSPEPRDEDEDRDRPARRFLRSHSYVQAAAWIAARLAEGLEHAHSRGILHRDLKPSNILIAADGTPTLLDFNLSADAEEAAGAEGGARARLGGTLPYMAPEHLDAFNPMGRTAASEVDARSDIYALGLILFEMLAGRHAFDEPPSDLSLLGTVSRMTEDRRKGAPPASRFNPAVPPSLEAILSRCLAADPKRRYARAAELAEDLQRFLDDRPNLHAPEPSLRERAAKWWRRHPGVRGAGPVAALSLTMLLAVASAGWSVASYAEGARARLRWREFQGEFERCQLFLNTTSGTASHRAQGIALAERLLGLYGVESPGDWTAGPLVRRLKSEEQGPLREKMSELLLLLARSRVAKVAQGAAEPERRKALQDAVVLLDRAAKIDPNPSAALYESRARYLGALGEADSARADRLRAEALPPSTPRDYYLRGTAHAAAGRMEAAESDLARVVAEDPRRFWAWFVLGLCHFDAGRYAEAAGDFSACTALAPDFAWPHLNRGLALAALGRSAEARACYDRALGLRPRFVEALVNRALCELELDDPEAAERDLSRAIELGRGGPGVLAARAEALARLGRRDRAEADFASALKARPGDPGFLAARGMARLAPAPAAARSDFQAALARDPRHARAHYGMGLLLRATDPKAALEHARKSIDASPGALDAIRLRAVLLGRLGDRAALADAQYLAARPSAPNLYNAACALALLDAARGEDDHRGLAREYLHRALDLGFPADQARADADLATIRD